MPPANSPSDTPATTGRTSIPLENQLAELAAPVPDLASTLMSRAEEEANEDNVSFLRTTAAMSEAEEGDPSSHSQNLRRLRQMDNLISETRRLRSEQESARRLRRAVLRSGMSTQGQQHDIDNSYLHNVTASPRDPPAPPRNHGRQPPGYQGWAPGTVDSEGEDSTMTFNELRALARGTSRPWPETATRRHIREEELGLSSNGYTRRTNTAPDEMDWQTSRTQNGTGEEYFGSESSLRTTALLHSVRRHARFTSPRSWGLMTEAVERQRQIARDRDRATDPSRQLRNSAPQRREALDDLRRGISDDLRATRREEQSTPSSHYLEEAIKYLERLRSSESYSEGLSFAEEGGFVTGEDFIFGDMNREDFILDTSSISPPQPSSWLRAGAIFSGSQQSQSPSLPTFHLTNHNSTRRSQPRSSSSLSSPNYLGPLITTRSWLPNSNSSHSDHLPSPLDGSIEDTWPVKVTINSVDHASMTLTGTMEAFNVPNKNSPYSESTIATYLEGEIIDFNRFTLETKSFACDVEKDGRYWRQLEPFRGLEEGELMKCVTSRRWLSEELAGRYVLMRWKEKCFITPSDAQVHLTISGFYFISLRREDGHVEGFYCDPSSSPYQHLSLTPANRDFPAYKFK